MAVNSSVQMIKIGFTAACMLVALAMSFRGSGGGKRVSQERGEIKAIDADKKKMVINLSGKAENSEFQWDDNTRFWDNEQPVTPRDLELGQHVDVHYQKQGNVLMAAQVEIHPVYTEDKASNGAEAKPHEKRNA